MSLFRCEQCGCVDSLPIAYEHGVAPNARMLCTTCQGKPWHGYFVKRQYDPNRDHITNHPKLKMN